MTKKNQTKIIAEPGKQELFITREFEAPREMVFEAWNDAEALLQWLGPRGQKMEIEKLDSRTHGSWRFFHYDSKGNKWGFNGVIHEVAAPERIIRTFEFEGLPEKGHVALETATFEALVGERTKLALHSVYKSVADRDAAMMSGMERGVVDSHERLDELLEKQVKKH
jgi:uncharacterized protein YndB with AHSA1/START domain